MNGLITMIATTITTVHPMIRKTLTMMESLHIIQTIIVKTNIESYSPKRKANSKTDQRIHTQDLVKVNGAMPYLRFSLHVINVKTMNSKSTATIPSLLDRVAFTTDSKVQIQKKAQKACQFKLKGNCLTYLTKRRIILHRVMPQVIMEFRLSFKAQRRFK